MQKWKTRTNFLIFYFYFNMLQELGKYNLPSNDNFMSILWFQKNRTNQKHTEKSCMNL